MVILVSDLGVALKRTREILNLSIGDVHKETGVISVALSNIENGKQGVSFETSLPLRTFINSYTHITSISVPVNTEDFSFSLSPDDISSLRKSLNWGLEDLASATGISASQLSKYERGVRSPSESSVRSILRIKEENKSLISLGVFCEDLKDSLKNRSSEDITRILSKLRSVLETE